MAANFGDAGRSTSTCSTSCEVVDHADDPEPARRAGPDGDPGRRGRLGRGRAGDRVDPQPGRAGHPGAAWPGCSACEPSRCASSPRTSAARSARSSAPTPSTRWSPGWRGELGRPARWTETRYENLVAMTHGRAQRQTVTIGGSRDGTVLAYRLEIIQDCRRLPAVRRHAAVPDHPDDAGPVRHPEGRVGRQDVVTNTTPIGAYRGAGRPEATAAIERAMDLFAAEIGMDPAEVRRRNLLPPFTEPHRTTFGALYDTGDYVGGPGQGAGRGRLRRAARGAGRAPRPRRRPASSASAWPATSRSPAWATARPAPPQENATVEVHPDGTATILTGTSPHGQGHATAWAMLASEELGIPVDKITLKWGDTDLIPEGGGTGGSRSLQQGGSAVQQASQELIEVARERAADELEAERGRPGLRRRARSAFEVAGDPDASVPLASLAETERLFVRTVFTAPGRDVPVRRARRRRRGRHRDRQGRAAPDGHRRRRRHRAQPAAGRGPAARRHRPGRGAGASWRRSSTTPTATR